MEHVFYNGVMPIDISQFVPQLRRMSMRASETRIQRELRIAQMQRVFAADFDCGQWNAVCEAASNLSGMRWTGAQFNAGEPINQFHAFGTEPHDYVLIAADGSQIMPDRHKAVQYAAIQVAVSCIVYGNAVHTDVLQEAVKSAQRKPITFLGEEDLYDPGTGELVPAGEISAERDMQEIELLADLCERFRDAGLQSVAVADGSLVPFSLLNELFVRNNARRAKDQLERITKALNRVRTSGAIVAGYIDRPNSNALARACALAEVPASAAVDSVILRDAVRRTEQSLRAILDRYVLDHVLPAVHRTSLFEPAWLVNGKQYLGQFGHTMRSCYVNVGQMRPVIARLEMPAWCSSSEQVAVLTSIMGRHARMGGDYPLCLKAAHEAAVLTHTDEREIDVAVERGLVSEGILATPSSKQEAKDKR